MKVTFIIKKAAKRYDTESMATIYVRFRNGRQLDFVAPTQLASILTYGMIKMNV